jgi:predicted metal-dependent hydrolase
LDVARQTLHNLWRDGHWWRPATWGGAWRLLMGRDGLLRHSFVHGRHYLREDFHPAQGDGRAAADWLAAHADLAPPVRASA